MGAGAPAQKIQPFGEISTYNKEPDLLRCGSVTGYLLCTVQCIKASVSLEELECELFALCRDHCETLESAPISMESVEMVHHLAQLQDVIPELSTDEAERLWADWQSLVETRPIVLAEYRWMERAVALLNRLMIKWELVDVNLYKYRNGLPPPVGRIQEQEYTRRQTCILCLDTIWFACACTHPPMSLLIPPSLPKLASVLQSRLIALLEALIRVNCNVNFTLYPGIEEALGIGGESSPWVRGPDCGLKASHQNSWSLRIAKSKRKASKSIGFHLLDLSPPLCRCLERSYQRTNIELRDRLTMLEQLYRFFEIEMLEAVETLKSAGAKVTLQSSISQESDAEYPQLT